MSDDYRNDKSGENNDKFFSESNEIDDFFAQFDEIAEGLNKDDTAGSGNKHTDALSENNSLKSAADADILKEEALKEGMHTLRMSATDYVLDGTTSFSEMVKVSFDV